MVGDELAFACQAHAVDAVWLEDVYRKIGHRADDEEGDEEVVASCQFGYEEDTGERGVHHA